MNYKEIDAETKHPEQYKRADYLGLIGLVFTSAGIFLAAQLLAAIIISSVYALSGQSPMMIEKTIASSTKAQFYLILAVEVFIILGVVLVLKLSRRSVREFNISILKPSTMLRIALYFAVYFVATFLMTILLTLFVPQVDVNQVQQIGFEGAAGESLILVFLALCVAVPIAEEVLFRGFLYRGAKKYVGLVLATIVTTIIFGLAHLEFGSGEALNWIAAIDTALFSLALIYTYEKEKTLLAPIILHAIKNTLAFIFLFVVKS
ncbi:MAG: CPBP family intramembrane metalloprotease [bacterium]|nr:CPBP family intramembrane metalloprotease [bacterium]